MNWEKLKPRLLAKRRERTGAFLLPPVVLDMQPGFVVGARLDTSSSQVRQVALQELEVGALEALPSRPNLAKPENVRRVVNEILQTIGGGSGRMGILLPDASVRVAVLRFETLPEHREEVEALVRWRMSGILPFVPEEARISYQILSTEEKSVELLAMALRKSVAAEYEAAFEAVSDTPSLVLPATAALLPLLPTGGKGSQVLVHVCSGSVTTVVMAAGSIRLWRNRQIEHPTTEADGEVASEVARVVATCSDHLKSEIDDLWIYVRPPAPRLLNQPIRGANGRHIQHLTSSASYAATLTPAGKEIMEDFGMTFAGLLQNPN